jgi:hypothetical protein
MWEEKGRRKAERAGGREKGHTRDTYREEVLGEEVTEGVQDDGGGTTDDEEHLGELVE